MPLTHTGRGVTWVSPRFLGSPTFSPQRRQQGLRVQQDQALPDVPISTNSIVITNHTQKEMLSCRVFFAAQADVPCFLQGRGSYLDICGEQIWVCQLPAKTRVMSPSHKKDLIQDRENKRAEERMKLRDTETGFTQQMAITALFASISGQSSHGNKYASVSLSITFRSHKPISSYSR